MKVSCFLPCRSGSQRIPFKNTKEFHSKKSLLDLKLFALNKSNTISEIILSTNDEVIIKREYEKIFSKVRVERRDENLCRSDTSTDNLIPHAYEVCRHDLILWTHVTSPFLNANFYDNCVKKFLNQNKYDSLMGVTKIQNFIWNSNQPLNYRRAKEKWPRTQTIDAVYEINSSIFLQPRNNYISFNDRIGAKPLFEIIEYPQNIDIDWPEDFEIAQLMARIYEKKFIDI